MDTTHREQYRIRSAEVDPRGHATPTAVANLLQEAAAAGARRLGVAVEHLHERGMTWYLNRLHLRQRRPPWIGETLEIETWPSCVERIHALRDFRLFLDGGADAIEIGVASSAWLLVDLESRKPIRRLPDELKAMHPDPPRRALDVRFGKLPAPPARDDAEGHTASHAFPLRRTDLDLNGHVNYGVFVDALMEATPEALWSSGELVELEIDFKAEARPGDSLLTQSAAVGAEVAGVEVADDEVAVLHTIAHGEDGRELVRARSRWWRGPASA
ncbi:MAG: acyl-ACP thioesterase domain-containing protein [Acidobacteriota bacterium]